MRTRSSSGSGSSRVGCAGRWARATAACWACSSSRAGCSVTDRWGSRSRAAWNDRPGTGPAAGSSPPPFTSCMDLARETVSLPGVAVRLDASTPGAGAIGHDDWQLGVTGIATRSLGRLRMHGNGGYRIAGDARRGRLLALRPRRRLPPGTVQPRDPGRPLRRGSGFRGSSAGLGGDRYPPPGQQLERSRPRPRHEARRMGRGERQRRDRGGRVARVRDRGTDASPPVRRPHDSMKDRDLSTGLNGRPAERTFLPCFLTIMDTVTTMLAKLTSKNQLTLPKAVISDFSEHRVFRCDGGERSDRT